MNDTKTIERKGTTMKTTTERTALRAFQASQQDGRLRFVFGTAGGPRISLCRPPQACYCTDGKMVYWWGLHSSQGEARPELAATLQGDKHAT